MKKLYALLLLMFSTAQLPAADIMLEPGPELVAGENDAEWRPLFEALGARQSIHSVFTEHRWFPFKKIPVELKGEMRLSPDSGLSLHYTEPEERTVVMDAQGLLLRDAAGKTREVPADPRAPAVSTALLPVLRFEWQGLAGNFAIHASRAGEVWRIDFVPRDAELGRTIGRIMVSGTGHEIRQLEFRRSAMQRVEIFIEETRTGVDFPPAEKKRFFR